MKSKKRITLLAVLVCLFALVLSLGIFSACGNADGETAAGGSYLYGTTAPAEDLGNAGDYYLDTESLKAYVKTAEGGWEPTALYSGAGKPADTEGTQGDLYLDTQNHKLYQKDENTWNEVLKLEGRDGVVWFSGKGDPNVLEDGSLDNSMKGDFYLDITTFDIYQKTTEEKNSWQKLGSIKGTDGKNGVHVFYGTGAPDDNKEVWQEDVGEGDLYFSVSDGLDGTGAGTVLYRYTAEGTWEELMREEAQEDQINIRTLEQLFKFAKSVNSGTDYTGKEVHLKANIIFPKEPAEASVFETIENTWTPIGTSDHPFKGTFDGEGHTISNLKAQGENAALFGVTGETEGGVTIKNVTLADAEITPPESGNAGILVAEAKGNLKLSGIKVENSVIKTGESTKDAKVGALVGSATGEVTVEDINVQLAEADTELEDQSQKNHPLIGSGTAKYEGENELDFKPSEGFVEKIVIKENGDQEAPTYEISSANGLKYFAKTVNGADEENLKLTAKNYAKLTVKLVNNIDLNNEEWTPIGTSAHSFQGTFDGQNKTISNLVVTKSTATNVGDGRYGLFGQLDTPADVKNFTIENVNLNGQQYVGAVAGNSNRGSISNVTVRGVIKIDGNFSVGGITGYGCNGNGVIENCAVFGNAESYIMGTYAQPSSSLDGDKVGGIIGNTYSNTSSTVKEVIKNCRVFGVTVSGTRKVGGIVGYLNAGVGVVGCAFVNGTVECNADTKYIKNEGESGGIAMIAIGGIVGQVFTYSSENTQYEKYPRSIKDNAVNNITIEAPNSYTFETTVKNDVKLTSAILGNAEECNTSDGIERAKNYIEATGNTVENVRYHGKLNDVAYSFCYDKPYISSATVYTVDQLKGISQLQADDEFLRDSAGAKGSFLTTINFAENTTFDFKGKEEFAPLSGANFNFDGHGSTITNVKFGKTDGNGWSGFVGWFGNGTIRNLTIKNATASGSQAGIFVGHCDEHTHLENVNLGGEITVTYEGNDQEAYPGIGAFTGMLVGNPDAPASSPTITGAKVLADAVVTLNFGTEFNPNEASKFMSYYVGYGANEPVLTGDPTKEEGAKIVLGGKIHVKNGAEFLAVLGSLQTYRDCLSGAEGSGFTLALAAGTYTATANEQFKLEADNVHIEGTVEEGGEIKTTIDASTFTCSGQAGFEVSGNGCSIENVKITCGSDSGDVSALKVTKLDNETDIVEGFTLKNAVIEGNAGHGLNLHGVNDVTVDNVTITMHAKCGISLAKATNVTLKNITTTKAAENVGTIWADIGFMYAEGDAYKTPCEVSIDFKTCTFGQNVIYSERPSSAPEGKDVIKDNETVLESGNTVTTKDSKTLTMTDSDNGWALAVAEA